MGYMGSIAMQGKSIVGSPTAPAMPPDAAFAAGYGVTERHFGMFRPGEEAVPVSGAYGSGPDVMDRRKE